MRSTHTPWRGATRPPSATLFLVAGVFFIGHAAVWSIRVATDIHPPTGVFAALGHLVAGTGLITLALALADRTPSLARGLGVVTVVVIAGWVVIAAEQLIALTGLLQPPAIPLPSGVYTVVLLSTLLAYVLGAVACRRAGVVSSGFALLVLTPAVLAVAGIAARIGPAVAGIVGVAAACGLALAMLAIGYTLHTAMSSDGDAAAGRAGAVVVRRE